MLLQFGIKVNIILTLNIICDIISDVTSNIFSFIWRTQMDTRLYELYEQILRKELVPALGCTEPGAVGYTAAKAASILGQFPDHVDMYCSANIIKNVKSVSVPNSNGMKGIEAAAVLGMLAGNPDDSLEIFKTADDDKILKTKELISSSFCNVHLQEDEDNLYIHAAVSAGNETADVIVRGTHTNIILIKKNNEIIFKKEEQISDENIDYSFMTIESIIEFADTADPIILKSIMEPQAKYNYAIAEEGLRNDYGANIGSTLLAAYGSTLKTRAKAKAAAGSDARMSGSSMPVVINSGSGNQGITLTVPVIEYAKEYYVSEEKFYRSLTISNLVSIHIKKNIGKLSAFCGAVSAACGAGAAITYMIGKDSKAIGDVITSTLANVGGIFCDGAKASCAAKIASSVDAAIMAHEMVKRGQCFQPGDGIVSADIEETIRNFGIVGREGMRETDISIMKLMIKC